MSLFLPCSPLNSHSADGKVAISAISIISSPVWQGLAQSPNCTLQVNLDTHNLAHIQHNHKEMMSRERYKRSLNDHSIATISLTSSRGPCGPTGGRRQPWPPLEASGGRCRRILLTGWLAAAMQHYSLTDWLLSSHRLLPCVARPAREPCGLSLKERQGIYIL